MARTQLWVDVEAFYEAMFEIGLHAQQMGKLIVAVGVFPELQVDSRVNQVPPVAPALSALIPNSDSQC